MIDNYAGDVCDASHRLHHTNMTLCDDHISSSRASNVLPQTPAIVPCSFMPIAPSLLNGNNI